MKYQHAHSSIIFLRSIIGKKMNSYVIKLEMTTTQFIDLIIRYKVIT